MGIQDDPVSWHSVSWKNFVFPGQQIIVFRAVNMLDHQKGQIPLNLTLPSRDNGPTWTHNVFSVSSTRAILHSFSERKNPWKRWRFIFWVRRCIIPTSPNLCWTPRGLSILVVIGWLLKAWLVEGFVDWLIDRLTAGWIGLPDGWWIGHVELMCSLLDGWNDGVIDWLNGRSFRWMFSWDLSGDENMTDIFWNKNGTIKLKKKNQYVTKQKKIGQQLICPRSKPKRRFKL